MTRSLASVRPTWFAALLIGLALGAPVRAQDALDAPPEQTLSDEPAGPKLSPEEADKKARALFEQGRQAYGEGQYRDAWHYFREAYLLSRRPELLYNVGQAADRMRMDRDALEAFKLYLARLPDAENRKEVENRVRALEERLQRDQGAAAPAPDTLDDDPAYAGVADPADDTSARAGVEPDDAAPAAPPRDGQPERQGWYASAALGLGLLRDSIGNLRADATLGSTTLAGHLALGHQVFEPEIVLGGALMFEWGLSPAVSVGDSDRDVDTANLTLFGPFIEIHLDPRSDGWHLFGAIAGAWFSLSDSSATFGLEDARGGALVLGGGYEWPLDGEWAIGALGRLTLAKVDQDTGKHNVGILSVLCNASWY